MGRYSQTEVAEIETRPPDIIDVLSSILIRHKYKPRMFPTDPRAAASYWINHQEPPHEFTEAVQFVEQGDKSFWRTPYHDRLSGTLKIFLSLKSPQQIFVIEHIERGIPWRGDTVEMFNSIVREAQKMQADKDGYIEKALTSLRDFKMQSLGE
jgi:hypothetical protein